MIIDEASIDQRVDNFLMRQLKGVPRSHIYQILRSGEVRVNSGRVDATYRLKEGDKVRVPPVRVAAKAPTPQAAAQHPKPEFGIVFEDEALLVIDKPSGVAVHGGSGVSFGVIEQLRHARPELRYLELVHRLDRETSGLLMIAKKRSALTRLHAAMRAGAIRKAYYALVRGEWREKRKEIDFSLRKYLTAEGERLVSVDRKDGVHARTIVELAEVCGPFSLVKATLDTGRTHQIRVHLTHLGYPLLGDDKYGDFELNRQLAKQGLKRMFLHAAELDLEHPLTGERLALRAVLPQELSTFLDKVKS
ncbi:MAG TPA: RluA family pseudouridine synthase [Burkholderiales bacterium]|nr:RluA family pseudouridine synthase [Burkholderiales bacterium]